MNWQSSAHAWLEKQWQQCGWWSWLMRPLAWLHGKVIALRGHWRKARTPLTAPVIVIGNLYVGGTGKTPVTCALALLLKSHGWRPGLVSRGYGRKKAHFAVGAGADLDWRRFGDEPALIARHADIPICVHANRRLAARLLLARHPDVNIVLSDDGLQHYRLERDFEILVQDERGLGNGLLLPAGPLREPPERAARANVIAIRDDRTDLAQCMPDAAPTTLEFAVRIKTFWQPHTGRRLSPELFAAACQQPCAAAAGIGNPQRFFDQLDELGIELAQTYRLADHAAMPSRWLAELSAKTILITEKDAIKIDAQHDPRLWVACAEVFWKSPQAELALLERLKEAGIAPPELPHGP